MTDKRRVVCPNCDAVNNVPADRPALAAKCGRCRLKLFVGEPVALNSARFRKHLANSDILLVVDFWAEWCGPCRSMAPVFAKAAQTLEPRARFIKIDVDANQDLAAEFGVRGIPALFAFKDGKATANHAGLVDGAVLRSWVERLA